MEKQKNFKVKGITLIALVITIIVLLILAGVSLNLIMGNEGILGRAENATNKHMIASVEEDVQLAIADLSAAYYQNEDVNAGESLNEYIARKLNGYKTQSGATIEIAEGEGDVEFKYTYAGKTITGTFNTETSGITISGVTSDSSGNLGGNGGTTPEPEPEPTKYTVTFDANGGNCDTQSVEIEENSEYGTLPEARKDGYNFLGWYTAIENGTQVDGTHLVTGNVTLYARWEEVLPTIVAKNTDTSNLTRKTNKAFGELFEITWTGDKSSLNIAYTVTGKLTFNNTSFSNTGIGNTSELELGTYTVKCKITTPTGKNVEATKSNVKITKLAETTVTNASNASVSAKAIYSGYDLAYFRDLVNGGQNTLNAKLMNDIDLANVCSQSIGSWVPMGNYKTSYEINISEEKDIVNIYYGGLFDGNSKKINNIYINEPSLYRQGLFSFVKNGIVKNLSISGKITAHQAIAGVVGYMYTGEVNNCINNVYLEGANNIGGIAGVNNTDIINSKNEATINATGDRIGGVVGINDGNINNCTNSGVIKGGYRVGGIAGWNRKILESPIIQNCINTNEVNSSSYFLENDIEFSWSGGIAGLNEGTVTKCMNQGNVSAIYRVNGGITGLNEGDITKCINQGNVSVMYSINGGIAGRNLGTVSYCANSGNVNGKDIVGGIVGNNRGYISDTYNISEEIKTTSSTLGLVGGIAGNHNTNSNAYIKNSYNKSKITGYSCVGGIVGGVDIGTMSNCYNIGTINASTTTNVGQVYGYTHSISAITNCNSTTESTMKGWDQTTINTNIGSGFKKKTNSLPILNITVNGVTF